jgi:hypothetical protein
MRPRPGDKLWKLFDAGCESNLIAIVLDIEKGSWNWPGL